MCNEIPLKGGRITIGVVKVDNTVRRPLSENSPFVHSLLQHLESFGFPGAPRFWGIDDKSREILSYLEGTVPSDLAWFSDNQLENAAKLIRHFHNATSGLAQAYNAEVICHNDLSPCNFVFVGGAPQAIIDFDAAEPGSRISDLSYAAWMWLDVGNTEIAEVEQRRRLALFCQAYGMALDRDFVEAMLQRQWQLKEQGERRTDSTMTTWAKNCYAWTKSYLAGDGK